MPIIQAGAVVPSTIGCVLSERERNERDDSDFFATVWLPEQGRAEEIQWGTTRGACGPGYGYNCVVDATPEVRAAYDMWRARRAVLDLVRAAESAARKVETVGNVVRVFKGRKVPKGIVGTVMTAHDEVVHVSKFGTWATHRTMLMIRTDAGAAWIVDAANCEFVATGRAAAAAVFDYAEACVA